MLQNIYPMDISPEELAAEQAATLQVKEEEVRAGIIEEFGFDEIEDAERIDKLTAKEMGHKTKLSAAIGQKIKHRNEAAELRGKITPPPPPPPAEPKAPAEDVHKTVEQILEKRDLDTLEYSEDLKKEIQRVAQIQGVSIKQAARDPYIAAKIDQWQKDQNAEEAAISRTNRSGGKKSYSLDNPPEVDMATPEGRKQWDDYLSDMKKAGN